MANLQKCFCWTKSLKKKARKELTDIANRYEVKQRKYIKGVQFLSTGQARYIGQAHDYSFWAN